MQQKAKTARDHLANLEKVWNRRQPVLQMLPHFASFCWHVFRQLVPSASCYSKYL